MDHPLYPCVWWDKLCHARWWEPQLLKEEAAVSSARKVSTSLQQAQLTQNPWRCWLGRGCANPCRHAQVCRRASLRASLSLLALDLMFRG